MVQSNIPSNDEIQSKTIEWLRFPLALAVIFIHNFGIGKIDLIRLHSYPFTLESFYDFVRIANSNIGTHFAVPIFFMFSGFLFFYKKKWNIDVYKQNISKRFKSLLIPYLLWISIYIIHDEFLLFFRIITKGGEINELYQYIINNGGIKMFWNCIVWGENYTNYFGTPTPLSGPILVPLWFLRDLIVAMLLSPLIYYIIKRINFVSIIILGVCYISGIFILIDGLSIICLFWFSLGAYFSINNKNIVISLYQYRYPAFIIALCTLLPLIWMNGRQGNGTNTNLLSQILYPIYVLSAVISVISIAAYLIKSNKVHIYPTITKTTFFIFLSHIFVLAYLSKLYNKIISVNSNYLLQTFGYLSKPIITATICIGIYYLLRKYVPRVLSLLVGSRI